MWEVVLVALGEAAHEFAPGVEVLPGDGGELGVVAEDGQDLDAVLLGQPVERVKVVEDPLAPLGLDAVPVVVGAGPGHAGLVHAVEGGYGILDFAAADMGADAVGLVEPGRGLGEQQRRAGAGQQAERCHLHGCSWS